MEADRPRPEFAAVLTIVLALAIGAITRIVAVLTRVYFENSGLSETFGEEAWSRWRQIS
jgi:hypothetical protein